MVMEYQETPLGSCVKHIFERSSKLPGLDGISEAPQQRGLDDVTDYVADYTISSILTGLGVDAESKEGRKVLSAYVSGKQQLSPTDFPSAMNRGKPRKITW